MREEFNTEVKTNMAGDWIKMSKSLPRDPRVVRISSALKADRLRTVGGLFSAWCLADELTEDGILDAYSPELFDEVIGFTGLARAMESVGWLIVHSESIEFPRFTEHNGKSAKRRAQDSVRKLSAREADKCPLAKRTKSGLEKRRIEKSNTIKPTLEECREFAASIGMEESDGEYCFHKWEGNGWVNGSGPVKNWKGTIQSWKAAKYLPSQKGNPSPALGKPKFTRPGIQEQLEAPML